MDIEVTPQAAEVLRRSVALMGGRGVRLRLSRGLGGGESVQVEVAGGPEGGETIVEAAGLTFYIEPEVAGVVPHPVVALEPQHEKVTVRSQGV